ncbi:DUF6214 family protein [Streptomyces sp. NPDC001315]|uniref:DUF6214 family protein n=1 Tax=Streptomyces sp. NPDC001315 TaxID=3364562 RepID=UPI00367EAC84
MSVWPAWKVREGENVTSWFNVRLAFADGARVDALAVVSEGCVSIEDVRAQPALSLGDLTVLAVWLERPLSEACGLDTEAAEDTAVETAEGVAEGAVDGTAAEPVEEPPAEPVDSSEADAGPDEDPAGPRRGRPAWPRGIEGRRLVAREYRAAQKEGIDPVLAVMCATGRSRRRSLRLIAQARDAGFLAPRHARR